MEYLNSNLFDKKTEEIVYQKLLSKSNQINEKELSYILERLRMLWLQRTDRLQHNESEILIWIHERFSYGKLPLPVPFKPKYNEEPLFGDFGHSKASILIEKNIREWFKNKYKMENPTFWDKILMKVFSKD
tara:strand:- start:81 stop:473 length:393 start_codon:yes stop_codon:yes gene_type:complete